MALLLMEGFDHYNTAALAALKQWQFTKNIAVSFDTLTWQSGRVNGQCVHLHNETGTSQSLHLRKALPAPTTTCVLGVAVQLSGLNSPALITLLNASSSPILSFSVNSAGKLTLSSGQTGTAVFVSGSWFYVELKVVLAGTSSVVSAQVNGAADIAPTTVSLGTSPVVFVEVGGLLGAFDLLADDLYVCDTTGSRNNDFLGDRHIDTLYPTSDGIHTDMVPNTGTAHYSQVNETNADLDTSYVSSPTLNAIDTYHCGAVSVVSADIRGIQTNLWARKDDAGLRQLAPVIRAAGTDYVGGTQTLATGYVDLTQIYEQNPATSADWTVTDVNTAEYGAKVVT